VPRVVFLAPDFAPSSLPPALRVRFFANHLHAFGWEPIVITVDPSYYEYDVDIRNNHLVSETVEVIRTKAISQKLTRRLGFGDIGIRSMWHQWQALRKLHRAKPIDVLIIPVPPFVNMALGRLAKERLGIPYVIDYIDPWRTDYFKKMAPTQRPKKWWIADGIAGIVEPFSVRKAAGIMGVSQGTIDMVLSQYGSIKDMPTLTIPYGAEPDDFRYVQHHPIANRVFNSSDGYFHISSVGHFNYMLRDTAAALFNAIATGLAQEPALFNKLRLHFIGTTYAHDGDDHYQVLALAEEMGVGHIVTEHPKRVPYLESLQIMLDSDALLVLGGNKPHYTASKIFPYLLARKPIMAVMHHDSSVLEVLRRTNSGTVVAFSNDAQIDSVALVKSVESLLCQSVRISENIIEFSNKTLVESLIRWLKNQI
jgi:glycosyltransferase involved in cell wall biosynthesis